MESLISRERKQKNKKELAKLERKKERERTSEKGHSM